MFPAKINELEELAIQLVAVSSRLTARLSPVVLNDIEGLLRVVNSYYSNLIEGHSTHPIDIERAMKEDYSTDPEKRDLQIESEIHIKLQEKILALLNAEPKADIVSINFLTWIHREFYERMPERLRWVRDDDNNENVYVEAGKIRERFVKVGRHIAPEPESLDTFLQQFAIVYNPEKKYGLHPYIALAAAHHRLMWIHPFLDGNGRVARLFTDAYFYRINTSGYGLWNVSRGLAKRRNEYRKFLSAADAPREGDLDGRGNLSDRTLTEFCRFFLEICLDQAKYMDGILALNGFIERLEKYVALRNAGLIERPVTKEEKTSALHPRTAEILKWAVIKGDLARRDVFEIIGMSERFGRKVLGKLLEEGLLISSSEKGRLRLGFPAHAASYWFPDLYPQFTS